MSASSSRNPIPRRLAGMTASLFLLACILQIGTSCAKKEADKNADPKVTAGRGLFLSHCISCHNVDPARDGSLGPAIKGSSLELIRARVLHGEYPPGYTPKRSTRIMVALPMTEEDVVNIQAYLASSEP